MAGIVGFGGYVPERVMTNEDWSALIDTTDDWITTRTGIKRRRFAAADETTLDLAEEAARGAIDDAGLTPTDIEEIVLATDTPELYLPDTSSLLQSRLGCGTVPSYDLGGSGCAGFVQALDVARARIHLSPRRILVVGVELISRLVSWKDRATYVLFGDGAGAVVMGPAPGKAQVLDVVSGTDGSKADILTLRTGGTKYPFTPEAAAAEDHERLEMNGREVFREAVHRMSGAVTDVLRRIGRTMSDVAVVIPHQANKRIIDAVRNRLGVDEDRVYVNVHEYGNTGSASVPFALWEAKELGRIHKGDLVVLTAFGAGFHWAAAAVQF
ncbi:MAG: 3-oxoacyl-ACP synthase III family protein [Acidimicrobiia bacterium]